MEETNKENSSVYFELYDKIMKFNILKGFIKENIKIKKDGIIKTNVFFDEELVKLIKYTDKEFYNELQQRAEQ